MNYARNVITGMLRIAVPLAAVILCGSAADAYDLRGEWRGSAKGTLFGAEGSVIVTNQSGEDFAAVVEGGNWLGRASFNIRGKIRGAYIFGSKEGNSFRGALYGDGTIRGVAKLVDGSEYSVFLQRSYSQWGSGPFRTW
ncbi:MAG: hypothetical protein AB1646_21710 [Thermodesulfobacteriota bacterium]